MDRRNVRFSGATSHTRPAYDDERSVMHHFARHVKHCSRCYFPAGTLLCSRGFSYAHDIRQYMFMERDQVYSVIDHNKGNRVRIEVPTHLSVVYTLLSMNDRTRTRHHVVPTPAAARDWTCSVTEDPANRTVDVREAKAHRNTAAARRTSYSPRRAGSLEETRAQPTPRSDLVTIYATIPSIRIPLIIKRGDLYRGWIPLA